MYDDESWPEIGVLMTQVINIMIGLSTTLIGYIIGRLWQRIVSQLPYRRARRFWGPALAGELQVVVSRFKSAAFVEPTGIVGGGDALALRELSSYFSEIGLKKFNVVYVDEARLDRKNNLILLGGPDTNEVTKDALELIKPRVRIFDPGPGIAMEIHDLAHELDPHENKPDKASWKKYKPKSDSDYGIIIRARNPFNPNKALIIFAGAHGYGTWGGVNLALEDNFLQSCEQLEPGDCDTSFGSIRHFWALFLARIMGRVPVDRTSWQLECIFEVSVFDERPHAPEIIVLRSLL